MTEPKKYMAGSVPRFFRLTRPGLFPPNCIIGSLVMKGSPNRAGEGVSNIIRDVVMMPQRSFQSMKTNASVGIALSPALRLGGAGFTPDFVFTDLRVVVVPPEEPDPEGFARNYFLEKFGLTDKCLDGSETMARKEDGLVGLFKASGEIFSRRRS